MNSTILSYAGYYFTTNESCREMIMGTINMEKGCQNSMIDLKGMVLIVFLSLFVKLPQILKIRIAKSTEGISDTFILSEVIIFFLDMILSIRKGMSLLTYCPTIIILCQSILITMMMFYYNAKRYSNIKVYTIWLSIAGMMALFHFSDIIPQQIIDYKNFLIYGLFAFGRIFQIIKLAVLKKSGTLSSLSTFFSVIGNVLAMYIFLTRTYESVFLILIIHLNFMLNFSIAFVVWYLRGQNSKKQKKRKVKND